MQSISHTGLVPILTYHSQNIAGNDYASNDRQALASDIQVISQAGLCIPKKQLLGYSAFYVRPGQERTQHGITGDT